MNDILITKTIAFFEKSFGSKPQKTVLSPGRINIIGEHVDYNDGYVLPAAIDKIICFAFEKNNTNTSKIIAIDLDDAFEIDLNAEIQLTDNVWTNYLRGVLNQLKIKGFTFEGFNCVFSSNIPVGSGLSSSAALECGFLFGIKELFDLNIKPVDIALMGQSAEHWVGINCGIMDQFSSVMGKEDKVIKFSFPAIGLGLANGKIEEIYSVLKKMEKDFKKDNVSLSLCLHPKDKELNKKFDYKIKWQE